MSEEKSWQSEWQSRARLVSLRVNLGWWLQCLTPALLLASLIGMVALLLLRRQLPEISIIECLIGVVCSILLLAFGAWWMARRHFETPDQSLVRMEAAMRLRSGLTAAAAGVAPWPAIPDKVHAGLRWHWQRVLIPPVSALALLSAGLLFPIHQYLPVTPSPDQPQAWERTESELARLEEEKVVDQEYIEEMRKKIDDLRAQDPQDWFSHASMEATDNMRKEHLAESKRLERSLSQASKALESLMKNPTLSDKEKARLANEFDQAMQAMQNGAMKPNTALLEQLKGLDPQQLGKLTPEQQQQLQQNLQKNAEQLKGQGQQGEGGQGEEWLDELLADGSHPGDKGQGQGQGNGEGEGECEGEGQGEGEGKGKGKGGIARGPGHDPNLLGKPTKELQTGGMEGLKATDLSRTLPGDLLELQDGKHDVDTSATNMRTGGGVSDTGKGGDRVWRDALDPQEQKALKKFFE